MAVGTRKKVLFHCEVEFQFKNYLHCRILFTTWHLAATFFPNDESIKLGQRLGCWLGLASFLAHIGSKLQFSLSIYETHVFLHLYPIPIPICYPPKFMDAFKASQDRFERGSSQEVGLTTARRGWCASSMGRFAEGYHGYPTASLMNKKGFSPRKKNIGKWWSMRIRIPNRP